MRARSNSAIEPRTPATSRPAGVLVSIPSPIVTNAMPRDCQSSSSITRWRRFRPSRSSRQHTTACTRWRPHVGDELVERGPAILRAADALVDVLDGGPAAGRDVAPQLEQLVLGGLVVRADARVDGDLHARLRRGAGLGARLLAFAGVFRVTPLSSSHARNARSTWTESGTPSRSLTRRSPSMMSASTRNAVSSFGDIPHV